MTHFSTLKLYGLTGGIASGKTRVLQQLAAWGVPTLSADALYHQLLMPVHQQPSALTQAIIDLFPRHATVDACGHLHRAAFAEYIFSQPQARAELEALVYPAIQSAAHAHIQQLAEKKVPWLWYEVPLLFEKQTYRDFDFFAVVLVWCQPEQQQARLIANRGLSLEDCQLRLKTQWPIHLKKKFADYVLDNSQSWEYTEQQLQALYRQLKPAAT